MLVLSRHRDESIIIGDDIVITVVDIRGDKVRLGIAAPIEISVHRQEVYEAIQRENRQASRLECSRGITLGLYGPRHARRREAITACGSDPEHSFRSILNARSGHREHPFRDREQRFRAS